MLARPPTSVFLIALVVLAGLLHASPRAWAADALQTEAPQTQRFQRIRLVNLEGPIDAMQRAYLLRQFRAADEEAFDCLVLRIDSPGGLIAEAKVIGDALLDVEAHTVAWIPDEALSAAAWISLACDEIVPTAGATFGDCQPIVIGAGATPEPIGEKIETALRAWFRKYAERKRHPSLLAQSMVSMHLTLVRIRSKKDGREYAVDGKLWAGADPDTVVVTEPELLRRDAVQVAQAIVAEGELLTLTGKESLDLGFVDRRIGTTGLPAEEAELLAALSTPETTIVDVRMSWGERAGRFLHGLSGVLSALVAFGVMLFLWKGSSLGGIVAASALIVIGLIAVSVEHLHGLPIFLILLGVVLIAAEVFLIPGFGVAGILGIGSIAAGGLFLMTGLSFEGAGDLGSRLQQEVVVGYGLQFVLTSLLAMVLLVLAARFMPSLFPSRGLRLDAPLPDPAPLRSDALPPAVGAEGKATTDLRPAGRARIDGRTIDVVTEGDYVAQGAAVRVLRTEGHIVTVRASAPPQGDTTT